MRIIIVAGFLGSGKTTLLLAVTEKLVKRTGKKVSIIVNDFGAIGIDGRIMEKYGLQIMELSSGCICCTLGPDLVRTVHEIDLNIDPDLVIIEPTGVADPQAIVHALQKYPYGVIDLTTMVVLDALRFDAIERALGMQLKAQLRAADIVLINKTDAANDGSLSKVADFLDRISPSVKKIKISALNGSGIIDVVDAIESDGFRFRKSS